MLVLVGFAILISSNSAVAQQTLSKQGKFTIELSWEPSSLEPSIPINFIIRFKDTNSDILMPHVDWTLTIKNEGNTVAEFSDHTMFGIVDFKNEEKSFAFEKTGNFEILIEAEQTEIGLKEDAMFNVSVVPESSAVTEIPKNQPDIFVAIKQKKKITLIAVKNNAEEQIFGFMIKTVEGDIKFIKARSWDRDRIDHSTVMLKTNDEPITKGRSIIIILITDNRNTSYQWSAFDKNNNEIAKGNLVAKSDVRIKPRLDELNFTINEYPMPDNASYPLFPVYDKKRNVIWISDISKPRLWAFNLETKEFKVFEHEGEATSKIALDSKQRVWFIDSRSKSFGYMEPEKSSTKTFKPPIDGFLIAITIDLKDNVWMAILDKSKIVSFNPQTEQFQVFESTTKESLPSALLIDRSGQVWFTEARAGKLGKLDPASGTIAEYQPLDAKLVAPSSIIQDSNGNIWIGEHGGLNVTRFDPETLTFERFSVPNKDALVLGMVEDRHGNIWYAQHVTDYIAVLDPKTGETKEIHVPTGGPSVQWLTIDGQGSIWFTEPNNAKIGSITITEAPAK